jgi:hypothetical protein
MPMLPPNVTGPLPIFAVSSSRLIPRESNVMTPAI